MEGLRQGHMVVIVLDLSEVELVMGGLVHAANHIGEAESAMLDRMYDLMLELGDE